MVAQPTSTSASSWLPSRFTARRNEPVLPAASISSRHLTSHTSSMDTHTDTSSGHSIELAPTVVPAPAPMYRSSVQLQSDMMASFFGDPVQREQPVASSPANAREIPPSYASSTETHSKETLPCYPGHPDDEPHSLARFMFIYGFLFPPFWVMGIVIMCSPLRTSSDWEADKTEAERETLRDEMRAEELKWARRSVIALTSFVLLLVLVVMVALFATRRH